jgi:hypothetical protein
MKKNKKITLIFDLDETTINSTHRTPNFPDGTLDLLSYKKNHTDENVAKDTLLPLAKIMQNAIESGYNVAILTARDMKQCDYAFLARNGIYPKYIYSRDKCKTKKHYNMKDGEYKTTWFSKMPKTLTKNQVIMFDDSKVVKKAMREIGVVCLCAHKINRKLLK